MSSSEAGNNPRAGEEDGARGDSPLPPPEPQAQEEAPQVIIEKTDIRARTEETKAYHSRWLRDQPRTWNPPEEIPIPPELIPDGAEDISHQKKKKLYKVILSSGNDLEKVIIKKSMTARVHYKMWLASDPDKKVIDSSKIYDCDEEPMAFTVGLREVMRALDECVISMTHKGEKALLLAHFDYAFGRNSELHPDSSHIPNKSFVFFEVELVDAFLSLRPDGVGVDDEDEINLEITHESTKSYFLTETSVIYVQVEGTYEGKSFFGPEILPLNPCWLQWGFTDKSEVGKKLPRALGQSVRSMAQRDGEKGIVTLKGKAGYGEIMDFGVKEEKITIPAGATVVFDINIWEIEDVCDPFVFSIPQMVENCEDHFRSGLRFAELQTYEAAAMKFHRVKEYLLISEYKKHFKKFPEDLDYITDLLVYLSCLALSKICTEGKSKFPGESKAEILKNFENALAIPLFKDKPQLMGTVLFERGLYLFQEKDYEDAKKDFEKCSQMLEEYFKEKEKGGDTSKVKMCFKEDLGINVFYLIRKFCVWYFSDGLDLDLEEPCDNGCVIKQWETEARRIKDEAKVMAEEAKAKEKTGFVLKWYPPK